MLGQQEGDGVELGPLALVHRHGVDGVDGGEPGGAHLGDALLALEGGGQPPAAGVDDDPGVAVEELQSVVVLGHDERAPDVPVVARREPLHLGPEPPLDVVHPCADAVGPPAVRAQQAEMPERVDGVRRPGPSRAASITRAAALDRDAAHRAERVRRRALRPRRRRRTRSTPRWCRRVRAPPPLSSASPAWMASASSAMAPP